MSLPPLPEPSWIWTMSEGRQELRQWAEQYGRLCAEAEREACALACDELWDAEDSNRQAAYGMELCASVIRARSQR